MAGQKRANKKTKSAPVRSQRAGLKRYLIIGVIAIVGTAAVIFLTRDNSKSSASKGTGSEETGLQAPMRTEFLKEGILSFYTPSGEYIATIDIELAEAFEERRLGMMFRTTMEENQGMFFIWPTDVRQSFWMKNTILPLDMIFINSNNEIVTIHKNTTPYAETQYPSTRPARFVLEVNAGFCDRVGISEGGKIGWMRTN